jgi:hypothetical protein
MTLGTWKMMTNKVEKRGKNKSIIHTRGHNIYVVQHTNACEHS